MLEILLIIVLFISISVALISIFYALFSRKAIARERLSDIAVPVEESVTLEKPITGIQRFFGRLGGKLPLSPNEQGKYARLLVAAGIRRERLPVFLGIQVFMMLVLPGTYIFFYALPSRQPLLDTAIISCILLILGYLIPSFQLRRMVRARQLKIFHDLPDVLDLMTVCVEAGLSMESAMLRISEDSQFRNTPLAKEMRLALQETRAGKPRADALRDMGERTMLDDLKSFCTMLIQTERLGTSLAQSLRIHADSLRTMRRQRAEELAAKTAIKLLFPLVFLIMPAIFVVVLMPALLRIIEFFKST